MLRFRSAGRRYLLVLLAIGWLLAGAGVPPAEAQTSRRELLVTERQRKAQELRPYERKRLESALLWVEESRLPQRLLNPYEGPYLRFGGLTKGAGLGGGVAYKQWLGGERVLWDSFVIASVRNYWFAGTGLTMPKLADERLEIGGNAYVRYWPRERYFGLGRDSVKGDRVGFLREGYEVRAHATVKPRQFIRVGGLTAFRSERIGEGHLPGYPSIEESFTDLTAPGLDEQADYWMSGTFVDVDYRDQPGNIRSGGHFRVDYEYWRDQDSRGYTFRRVRGEALHAFPIFDKKRVFVVRAIAESTGSPDGNQVPFFHMPTIGGSTTLRGYTEFRFRDRNMMLFNAEYRWEAFSGLDMALFADWGDVAPTWDELQISRMKSGYGLGLRFNTFRAIFLRLDIGRSSEGLRVSTSFSGPF